MSSAQSYIYNYDDQRADDLIPFMPEIRINTLGTLTRSHNSSELGKIVQIQSAGNDVTDGYYIYIQRNESPDFNLMDVYDYWVESRQKLETFFHEAGWGVEWRTKDA